ncbi:MAG: ABC transporter substrate-binding protein [Verrucomicrobiales bacterium]
MLWLRSLVFAAPLATGALGVWLFERVADLRFSHETEALVYAIEEPIGYLNPLVPLTGIDREVTDLLFEPLLTRDDNLNLRPNLIDSWTFQTVVTVRCSSEEAAGEAEAKLRSGEYLVDGMDLLALVRAGNVLSVTIEGFEPAVETRLLERFDPENLGGHLMIRLSVNHSVRDSLGAFLEGSVEKSQIEMIEYDGDTVADVFVEGDTDLFLRELRLYYGSNRSLDPVIETLGEQSHTSRHEMLVDLRRDVRWHDGARFTADDVVFSYRELTGRDSPFGFEGAFWFVEDLEKIDAYRLRVACRDTPAIILESWEKLPVVPKHLMGGGIGDGDWVEFFRRPVGNGPYRMTRRRKDGGVELAANPMYFRGPPLQEELVYRKFGSLESILLSLRSNRVHAIVPDERFSGWSDRNPGLIRELRGIPRYQQFVAWNLDRKPLDRKGVRLALARAIDLDAVLLDTAIEFQQPTESLFFPGMPYGGDKMTLPVYDPRSAERALEESGYSLDESRGVRVDEHGEPFALTLTVNEENGEHLRLARVLAEQWAGVGVTVKVTPLSWNRILTEQLPARDFDAVMLGWELPFERDRYQTWHSSSIDPGGGNFCGLRNQDVDEILEKIRHEPDSDRARDLTGRLNEKIAGLQPCFFVCDSGRIVSLRRETIEIVRPPVDGETSVLPVGVGKAGLRSVRPWWVRTEVARHLRSDASPDSP